MSVDQEKEHAQIPVKMAADNSKHASELANNAKEVEDTTRRRLETEREIVQTLAAQNTSIREYQKNAHEANQASKEREKNHQISTGKLDFGTLNRKKMIQDKHDRIMKQRAANKAAGRDEDEGVEQWTQEDMQNTDSNEAASISQERQAMKTTKQYGLRSRHEEQGDNKAAEDRQNQADEIAKKQNSKNDEGIKKSTEESKKLLDELGDKIKESFKLEDLVNTMRASFDKVKADVAELTRSIGQWTSGG